MTFSKTAFFKALFRPPIDDYRLKYMDVLMLYPVYD